MVSLGHLLDTLRIVDPGSALEPADSRGRVVERRTQDSRHVRQGDMFACVRGENHD